MSSSTATPRVVAASLSGSPGGGSAACNLLTVRPASAGPGDMVTISIVVVDETGVQSVSLYTVMDGTQNDICGQSTSRVSGDALCWTWEKVCTVADLVVNGTYVVRGHSGLMSRDIPDSPSRPLGCPKLGW